MNKKSVAVGVYKNPAIQKFLKEGVLSSIQINSLIVEELLIDEDLLDEVLEDWQKKADSNIANALTRTLSKSPVEFIKAVEMAQQGNPAGINPKNTELWSALDGEQKQWVCTRFLGKTRTKEVLVQLTQGLTDEKNIDPEKAAEVVVNAVGVEDKVDPEELAAATTPDAEGDAPEGDELYNKVKEWIQSEGLELNPKVAGAGNLEQKVLLQTSLRSGLPISKEGNPEGFEKFKTEIWPKLKEEGVVYPIEKEGLVRIAAPGEEKPPGGEEAPEEEGELTPEGQYVVDTVVAMFLKTAPDLPTEKRNLKFLSNDDPESKPLQAGLANLAKTDEKVKPFLNSDHPEYEKVVAAINKKWQGEETPGEEDEPSGVEEAIDSLDDVVIEQLREGTEEFISNFMKVATLTDQSRIFKGVWDPIRHIAQVLKGALDKEKAALTDRTPGETMQEEEEEASSGNRVIAASRVVRRHIDRVKEILPIYEEMIDKQIKGGKIEMGSHATLKKYGDQDPKRLLYKILKLIVKDIVGLSTHIGTLSKKPGKEPGQDDQENPALDKGGTDGTVGVRRGPVSSAGVTRQPSVSGRTIRDRMQEIEEPAEESRGDKIKKVADAYVNSKGLLAKLIDTLVEARADNTQRPDRPSPTPGQPSPEQPTPVPEGVVVEKVPGRETDEGAVANSAKNQSLAIYKLLQPIKEYFPTANPLQSEYEMKTAVKAFKQAISGLTVIVEQLQEFKSDSQLPPELLDEFDGKLDAIKKTLIEYFGLKDIGDGQLGIVSSEGRPANTPATADQEDPGEEIIPLGDAPPGDAPVEPEKGKPLDIGDAGKLKKFLTSSSGLFDASVQPYLSKFDPEGQKALVKFLAYLIGHTALEKDPGKKIRENVSVVQTTFSKYMGYEFADVKELTALLATKDKETLEKVVSLISSQRTRVMALLKKVSARMKKFQPWGSWKGRLSMITAMEFPIKTAGDEIVFPGSETGAETGFGEHKELEKRIINKLTPIIREQLKRSKYG